MSARELGADELAHCLAELQHHAGTLSPSARAEMLKSLRAVVMRARLEASPASPANPADAGLRARAAQHYERTGYLPAWAPGAARPALRLVHGSTT